MDTQRLILFVIFSFSALFLWERWQAEHRPPLPAAPSATKPTIDTPSAVPGAVPAAGAPGAAGTAVPAPVTGEKIAIRTDRYVADVDTLGGVITQVALTQHRDTEREHRARIAQAFLSDPTQRAMAYPSPTETHCYLLTAQGRELFESKSHEVPARLVPAEAFRRFMTDRRDRRERSRPTRAAQKKQHDEKLRFAADWIAAHGTTEHQARQAAGLLSLSTNSTDWQPVVL